MARGISLTREGEVNTFIPNRGDGWRIRIIAHDAVAMPNTVFGHRLRLVDPHTNEQGAEFCFVCSPEDLVVYPAHEPDPLQTPPFYRSEVIDVIVASRSVAEELWDAVRAQVCVLVTALNRKDRLVEEATERCGDPLDEETSEMSESLSESASVSESVSVSM